MLTHQIFFESSCQIDVGFGVSGNHLDLSSKTDCETKEEAKLLLEKLRERLRSGDGASFAISHASKQRLLDLLSKQ